MNKEKIISLIALVLAVVALGAYAIITRTVSIPQGFGGASFATFGEAAASSTQVTLLSTTTVILAPDARRTSLSICNESSTAATVAFNNHLAVNVGVVISGNSCTSWQYPSVPVGSVYGIVASAASGTIQVGVTTGDGN